MLPNENIANLHLGTHFFIFGLSGVGKTTFIEEVCRDKRFYLPRQVTTRPPRLDDNVNNIEYVSREVFRQLRLEGRFLIEYEGETNSYGYKKSSLKVMRAMLFYGLPAKVDAIRQMDGICILIQGNATKGLEMRGDSIELRKGRERENKILQVQCYGNPVFQEKMDLILINEFGKIRKIVALFKRFVYLKQEEQKALQDNPDSLQFVLNVYSHPIEGMLYKPAQHLFWMQRAFKNESLCFLFYSRILNGNRHFLLGTEKVSAVENDLSTDNKIISNMSHF